MRRLSASTLVVVLAVVLASSRAGASADISVSPTEMVFKSPLEMVVARTDERSGKWRSLCLEARGGAARVPVAGLERFGRPQLHRLTVSHAGGAESDDAGNIVLRSVVILRYVAEVWPEGDDDTARYFHVMVMIPNSGGERMWPTATVQATEQGPEGEELPDGDNQQFALEVDIDAEGHCPVPAIRWVTPPSESSTPRDGRSP